MRNIVDPRQERLLDPFRGLFPPIAIRILGTGWQGVFRLVILELLTVAQLARHFHPPHELFPWEYAMKRKPPPDPRHRSWMPEELFPQRCA